MTWRCKWYTDWPACTASSTEDCVSKIAAMLMDGGAEQLSTTWLSNQLDAEASGALDRYSLTSIICTPAQLPARLLILVQSKMAKMVSHAGGLTATVTMVSHAGGLTATVTGMLLMQVNEHSHMRLCCSQSIGGTMLHQSTICAPCHCCS
jgi:hypothetical protein